MVAITFDLGPLGARNPVLARHANAKVTLTVYAGLTDGGRERASTKLAEGGLGAQDHRRSGSIAGVRIEVESERGTPPSLRCEVKPPMGSS